MLDVKPHLIPMTNPISSVRALPDSARVKVGCDLSVGAGVCLPHPRINTFRQPGLGPPGHLPVARDEGASQLALTGPPWPNPNRENYIQVFLPHSPKCSKELPETEVQPCGVES